MRTILALPLLTLAAALAACSAEKPGPAPANEPAGQPADATGGGPAGEVAPESRVPEEAETATAKPGLPEGVDEHWALYYEHIPFVFGADAGQAKAAETGKPMMMFYTATW